MIKSPYLRYLKIYLRYAIVSAKKISIDNTQKETKACYHKKKIIIITQWKTAKEEKRDKIDPRYTEKINKM